MAMLPNVFRAEDNRGSGFDPIPSGWYEAEATKSELKDTKSGGKMLSVAFKIIDGEYAKRVVYANFNLVNANPMAVEIAQRELAALCDAAGVDELEDSADLHGVPVQIKLKIEAGNAQYPDRNAISGYKKVD
jgi:hypothetical protein